jgi:hypothetical protein
MEDEEKEKSESDLEPKDTLEIKYPWGFVVNVKQSSGRHRIYKGPDGSIVEKDKS